jgi:hypothetical protein
MQRQQRKERNAKMYSLNLEWETVQSMVLQMLKEDYKSLHADLKRDFQHPDDRAFNIKMKEAFGVLFRYYMASVEADEFVKSVEEGKEDESIQIHMDEETTQKVFEAALYSAINNYLQEQKDAVQRQIDLGNTQS